MRSWAPASQIKRWMGLLYAAGFFWAGVTIVNWAVCFSAGLFFPKVHGTCTTTCKHIIQFPGHVFLGVCLHIGMGQQEVSLSPWAVSGTSSNARHGGDLPGWSSEAGKGGRGQEHRNWGTKSCPSEFSTQWQSGKQTSSLPSAACCLLDHSASLVAPGWSCGLGDARLTH